MLSKTTNRWRLPISYEQRSLILSVSMYLNPKNHCGGGKVWNKNCRYLSISFICICRRQFCLSISVRTISAIPSLKFRLGFNSFSADFYCVMFVSLPCFNKFLPHLFIVYWMYLRAFSSQFDFVCSYRPGLQNMCSRETDTIWINVVGLKKYKYIKMFWILGNQQQMVLATLA